MKVSRPYASKRGGPPSVTTILDAMGGKHLEFGATKETALYVRHHLAEVTEMFGNDADGAVDHLRRHFRGVWDGRAAMGTLVHAVNEAWIGGETVDVAEMVAEMCRSERNAKTWTSRQDEVVSEALGYVDGLERFWTDFAPITLSTEEVVRHTDNAHPYIGTRDWIAEVRGELWLLDIKTTGEQDPLKGMYPDSWRLQLAAYRFADQIVDYDEDGKEAGVRDNYPVGRTGILHLRGVGHCHLLSLRAERDEWATFLRLHDIHRWLTTGSKTPHPEVVVPSRLPEEALR